MTAFCIRDVISESSLWRSAIASVNHEVMKKLPKSILGVISNNISRGAFQYKTDAGEYVRIKPVYFLCAEKHGKRRQITWSMVISECLAKIRTRKDSIRRYTEKG